MSATDKSVTKEPAKKRVRTPINGERTILEVSARSKEPGFHYAWIVEKNVYAAQEAGYEVVRHPVEVGNKRIDVGQIQGGTVTMNGGQGTILHLMRQPDEFWEEDSQLPAKKATEQFNARVADINSNGLDGSITEGGSVLTQGHSVR